MSELGEISVSTLHHATLDRPKKPANMRVPSRPFLQAQLGTRDPGRVTTAVNSSRPKGKTNNKSSKVAAAPRMSTDSGREFSSSDEMSMNMSATKKQKTSRTRRFFKVTCQLAFICVRIPHQPQPSLRWRASSYLPCAEHQQTFQEESTSR